MVILIQNTYRHTIYYCLIELSNFSSWSEKSQLTSTPAPESGKAQPRRASPVSALVFDSKFRMSGMSACSRPAAVGVTLVYRVIGLIQWTQEPILRRTDVVRER